MSSPGDSSRPANKLPIMTALAPAAFDQPYGLYSSPTALTALHLRYLNGVGPSLGIQQNLIGSNDGYIAGAFDVFAALSKMRRACSVPGL